MRTIFILSMAVLLASSSIARERDLLVSREYGISISPPVAKEITSYPYTMAVFFLPYSDGFSATVNVQKQVFAKSLEEYDQISRKQFRQFNATVLQHKGEEKEILYEWKALMEDRNMHYYSRVVKQGNFIYLITATGLESRWNQQKAELMKSVDSFQVME
ncbi:MAG: hypothetical protein JXA11_14185 [Phycisphaerae bacterium]|nr:hypothetical protein [Phycisphaerae bacterium]